MSATSRKLVTSSGTYLCLMQESACEAWTLEGMFPLRVKGVKMQKGIWKELLG
jgi:hypothetical protein